MNESIPVAGKEEEERGKLLPFNMMRKHVSWVYNFFKKGLWAIYKIDIMKKVVTLQNDIGLESWVWVLKPFAFCEGPNCQKPILFIKDLKVPPFYAYNKLGGTPPPNFIGYPCIDMMWYVINPIPRIEYHAYRTHKDE